MIREFREIFPIFPLFSFCISLVAGMFRYDRLLAETKRSLQPSLAESKGRFPLICWFRLSMYSDEIFFLVPMSESEALYFARIGVSYNDLGPSDQLAFRRNTGAYINLIYKDSPAYYANMSPGDIIIEVNGVDILDSDILTDVLDSIETEEGEIRYIRDGEERTAVLKPFY